LILVIFLVCLHSTAFFSPLFQLSVTALASHAQLPFYHPLPFLPSPFSSNFQTLKFKCSLSNEENWKEDEEKGNLFYARNAHLASSTPFALIEK
jgi:hypothetical protein